MSEIKNLELSVPQYVFSRSRAARNLLHCGQGLGKTFNIGLLSFQFVMNTPKITGFLGANTYQQLSDSTLVEVFKFWKNFVGWTEYNKNNKNGFYVINKEPPPHFVKSQDTFFSNNNKIFFQNGAVIMLGSLDNYSALDGRNMGWAILDETKDTREEAVKDVITARLRQSGLHVRKGSGKDHSQFQFVYNNGDNIHELGRPCNPLFVLTSPSKVAWLSEYFRLEEHRHDIESTIYSKTNFFYTHTERSCIVIASTFHNYKNLPKGFIENRLLDLSDEQAKMQIYGSPFGKIGSEFYTEYSAVRNVKELYESADSNFPIHVSFDFNVHPYMPAIVFQCIPENNRTKVRFLKEYTFASPRNTIESVCDALIDDYGSIMQKNGFFYYGDASGKNSLPIEQKNYFEVVEAKMYRYLDSYSKCLLKQNPRFKSVKKGGIGRRDFMNRALKGRYDFDIEINESCKLTIMDFEFVREDENGAKLKKNEMVNGVSCQKYGHLSDCVDAAICYLYGDWARDTV